MQGHPDERVTSSSKGGTHLGTNVPALGPQLVDLGLGDVRPLLRLIQLVLHLAELGQPSQGCPVWHSPQTCSVFKTRHRYPLPGMNLCCPACSVRIHIHCIYSSCASDRCLQTWGFSAHLCSSTPHPHVPVHPSVFFYPGFLSRPNANSWPLAVLHLNALPWSYGIWTVSN